MRLLILGGTAFVGRTVVEAALARGWSVTTFNRGLTGDDVPGAAIVRGDREQPADVARAVAAGPWDAVVDTSGYVPSNVLEVASQLAPVAAHYVFVSTVSVYAGWPTVPLTEGSSVLPCPPDAGPGFGDDVEDGPTRYGYQKSGCEAAAWVAFADRLTVLRPGVVLGPHEYVGRLPWWLRRVAAGGRVVAPGEAGRPIQPVDVRDVADFVLTCAEYRLGPVFNVTAPVDRDTFGGLLRTCQEVTGSDAELLWVPDEQLLAAGVRQWSELPLWRVAEGVWRVDSSSAARAGLVCRPQRQTVEATWRWMLATGRSARTDRSAEIGLSPERERQVLRMVSS